MDLGYKSQTGLSGSGQSPAHEQVDDDGSLGPLEIICDSCKLLRGHAVTFLYILSTIVLPAAIVMLLNQCFFYAIAHKFLPYPKPPPPEETRPDVQLLILVGVVLLVLGFAVTVNLVAAVFFSVSVLCTGKSITFQDVLRALPGQWKGVAVTGLWGEGFFLGLALILVLSQILIMMFFDVSRIPLAVLIILTFTVSRGVFFLFITTLQTAFAVTVFEKLDGFKSFLRSRKLLKHKWCTALGIFVVVEVPKSLLGDALSLIPKSEQTLNMKIVFVVMAVVLTSLLTLLSSVSYALFYKSCHSGVNESLCTNEQFKIGLGYRRL